MIKILNTAFMALVVAASFFQAPKALALSCADGTPYPTNPSQGFNSTDYCRDKGGVSSTGNQTNTTQGGSSTSGKATIDIDGTSSEISGLIQSILNIIYGISGVSIIGVIILAGIQYSSSNGNPQAVSAAKKKIQNAVLALVVLAILYPFLQWIVPGGAFN